MSAAAASWAPWQHEAAATSEAPQPPRLPPWERGQPVTENELRLVYRRAFGRELPQGAVRGGLVAALERHLGALRFDFEINRMRGYTLEG